MLRTFLLVSFCSLLLTLLGGSLVLRAATTPARQRLEAHPRPEWPRSSGSSSRSLAAGLPGGQPRR